MNKINRKPLYEDDPFANSVMSANECTGMAVTVPNEEEAEALKDLSGHELKRVTEVKEKRKQN